MNKKSAFRSADVPKEGSHSKKNQVIISPTESEIEGNILSAEPRFVEEVRKHLKRMLTSSGVKGHILRTGSSMMASSLGLDSYTPKGRSKSSLLSLDRERIKGSSSGHTPSGTDGQRGHEERLLDFLGRYDQDALSDLGGLGQKDAKSSTSSSRELDRKIINEMLGHLHNLTDWLPQDLRDALNDPNVSIEKLRDLIRLQIELQNAANKVFNNPKNKAKIVEILKSQLGMLLHPLEILHLFHKYDPNVLVQEDIDAVAKRTLETNDATGTIELLNRLVNYHGWYPCLMSVLKDKEVGLGHLAADIFNAFAKEFKEIKKAQKSAKKGFRLHAKMVIQRHQHRHYLESKRATMHSSWSDSDDLSALRRPIKTAAEIKRDILWEKMMEGKGWPKYSGLDWDRPLASHALVTLPLEQELCTQNMQLLKEREVCEVTEDPGSHERMLDPWMEGQKYVEKYAITELLAFMLSGVILKKPDRPMDFLIDMSREINRLDTIRQTVQEQAAEKRRQKEKTAETENVDSIVCDQSEKSVSGTATTETF